MAKKKTKKQHISHRQPRYKGRFAKQEDIAKLKSGEPITTTANRVPSHTSTFAGLLQKTTQGRVYFNPDECVRRSRVDSQRMRLDIDIRAPLEERLRAVALLDWHLEAEDKKDPAQKLMVNRLTRVINQIPNFLSYRMWLAEAIFYGRSAVQNVYSIEEEDDIFVTKIADWLPVHPDKLIFTNEGALGVKVGPGVPSEFKTTATSEGKVHFFTERSRPLMAVHKHLIEDGEFSDIRTAGSIHGLGARHYLYWAWWLKQETMGWSLDHLERWGNGLVIFYFDAGNPESEEKMRTIAESQSDKHALLIPRPIGEEKQGEGIEHIELNGRGIEHIKDFIQETFRNQIKTYLIGQTLTSESHGGGIDGGGTAGLHERTKADVIRFDALNLSETLTRELLWPLARFNFPNEPCRIRFVVDVDQPNVESLMDAAQRLWQMGVEIDADHLRSKAGLPKPEEGAELVNQLQASRPAFA